jgi:hypothetical protein
MGKFFDLVIPFDVDGYVAAEIVRDPVLIAVRV